MKLTVLIDSHEYVDSDPYQKQFHARLAKEHECQYVELSAMHVPEHSNVYVALRFRHTIKFRHQIALWLAGRPCIAQDYDPWVFFDNTSQHCGGYEFAINAIPGIEFAVPNRYWANIIRSKTGAKVHEFRLGMAPELCDAAPWESRTTRLEFRGSPYPVREANFQKLSAVIPVSWEREKIVPYSAFLKHLSSVRVWAHDESEMVSVGSVEHTRNWLWPKAIEVLSRGCFLIRDWHPEAETYGISGLPTAFLYGSVTQTASMLDQIERMPAQECNDRIEATVKWVREQDFYGVTCKQMETWWQ